MRNSDDSQTPELLTGFEKVNKQSISSTIIEMIKDKIVSGELRPGDKLPTEIQFASTLGIGRNSVREAMKMLSSLGVIEIKRGAGTFVATETSSSVLNPLVLSLASAQRTPRELEELRIMLETGIMELACDNSDDEDIQRLVEINQAIESEWEKRHQDHQTLIRLDFDFHIELTKATKNSLVIKLGESLYSLFYSSMKRSINVNPEVVSSNHRVIIEALKCRDYLSARQAVRDSLNHWRRALEKND